LQATTKVLLASFSSLAALGPIVLRHTLDPMLCRFWACVDPNVFFYWRIFAKIQPEKCDFDQYKRIFHGKTSPNFPIFKKKKKNSKSPDFYNKFQYVAKNIEGSWFFSTIISGM
jgi:hypothetical protein